MTSFTLRMIAMLCMLLDHMWATAFSQYEILTWVGRIAYPIFAFLLVEGYFHTTNFKKYLLRLFIWALISEIPFNLMCSASIIYPYHQNVLWTFIMGLLTLRGLDTINKKYSLIINIVLSSLLCIFFILLATITMVDYLGAGIMMILVFYYFRGKKWWQLLGQLIGLYYINFEILGGYYMPISIFGYNINLIQQGMACFSLIPIWLYNGKQGLHNKYISTSFYAFYPLHIMLLYLYLILK